MVVQHGGPLEEAVSMPRVAKPELLEIECGLSSQFSVLIDPPQPQQE
jgi:hypothetical protein